MQNFSLNEMKKNALLQMAGRKIGADPAVLKQKLDSGNVSDVVEKLDPATKEQLASLLSNKEAMSRILGSDQVQNLLKSLQG